MIRNFLAYELALKLHRKVEAMPLKHNIRDQLIRASQSIVLNLAEGSAKPTTKDKRRFYAIAFGSTKEVQAAFELRIPKSEILNKKKALGWESEGLLTFLVFGRISV